MSLSLAGPCVMEFRRGDAQRIALLLPPRSLLIMAGEARYGWCHYIPHRRSDTVAGERTPRAARRVSFTFRKARMMMRPAPLPCGCETVCRLCWIQALWSMHASTALGWVTNSQHACAAKAQK